MSRALPVVILIGALLGGGCVRECKCTVTVAPGADGCLVVGVEEASGEAQDSMDPGTLDALWSVGRTAFNVVAGLIL